MQMGGSERGIKIEVDNKLFKNVAFSPFSLQQRGSSPQIRFSGLSAGDGHDGRFLVSLIKIWCAALNKRFRFN